MTGSEKGHKSMTSGEHNETGRHRHHSGTWTPEVLHPHAPAHAAPEPAVRIPPPTLLETTVPGLRKFDLGTIPATVTPPSTWRRAAWFAVGASLLVVFGLMFATASLVGRPKNTDTIDALPGYPSLPVFLDSPTPPAVTAPPKPAATTRSPERSTVAPTPARRSPNSSGRQVTMAPLVPPVPSTSIEQPPPFVPPVRQTTPKRAFATNDPKEIGDRTETFYAQVTKNPGAAYQMTTGEMQSQGEQAFRQRYSGIQSVEVRRINIDPNQGTTVSEVKITKTDGSTFVERRRLKFTSGSNPKISSEVTH
ncbi:hypothetical protein JOF56_002955 [Kibdelosporangium banguiense]|uniref:Uncharacterized protein n=1 Tax=Kibdelosporangium banguiense TaxID=1365924 RepID=A0ABS4TDS6_9PSEU|nr:hypothetical protein [Kibdelosporangium banguiense]MBP2322570.1 hypothetical protein [Kibdelosporangium banguiense]